MASKVDICNRALSKLGAARITSLTDDSVNARACNAAFDIVRDAELRAHTWNFAIKRAQLAADSEAPLHGPATQYPLPSDFLRLLPPDTNVNYNTLDLRIEGRNIVTDEDGALDIRYVYRVTDTGQFDALFIEALASKLAAELCEELTQSNSKREIAEAAYVRAIREARKANAFENLSAEMPEDEWITVRA